MTDSIEKVTLESAAEQLKLKIRNAFVELLPEAQWKEMVAAELRRFTQPGSDIDQWGQRRAPPPAEFSKICTEVFTETLKAQIKAILKSPDWTGLWGSHGNEEISEAVKSWLTANSGALIQSTVQSLAGHAAQQLIMSMRHAP